MLFNYVHNIFPWIHVLFSRWNFDDFRRSPRVGTSRPIRACEALADFFRCVSNQM